MQFAIVLFMASCKEGRLPALEMLGVTGADGPPAKSCNRRWRLRAAGGVAVWRSMQ
jgi:hypothetical protein